MRTAEPLTQGAYLEEFEKIFSDYHEGLPAFATSSCAGALELIADLIQIHPGDEVIIPAHTYVASAIPFARHGAKLIWADIDSDTRVITANSIAPLITSRTKAVVMVHLYGLCGPMDEIMALSEKHGFYVIEDCAQALGASYRGKKCGTFGHLSCYSFHAQKNITTLGEGGIITTRLPEHAKLIPGLRHNGHIEYPERPFYWQPAMVNVDFDIEGVWPHNFSIGEPQCALGTQLMKRLDDLNARRYRNARRIVEALSDYPELKFQIIPEGSSHVYHLLCARYDSDIPGVDRNDLIQALAFEHGIQAVVQYYPLYRYPLMVKAGFGEANCPNTDQFFDNMLSLPFYEWYSEQQIDLLIDCVRKAVVGLRNR
jgi:dTDP-4-amino-4,6-dideoxygalactose transaminase